MGLHLPALLKNPILEREFVAFCRTKRWFVMRTALVALMVVVLWVFLWFSGRTFGGGQLDEIGRLLFAACAFTLVIFIAFLTPGLIADIIVSERRRETLEILLVSPLRPSGIVFGKLLSRIALLAAMVAASFPVVCISLLFGGVRLEQVVGLFMVTLGTILFAAGPAIFFSAVARRLGTAAVLSYVFPFAFCIGLPVILLAGARQEEAAFAILARTHVMVAAAAVAVDDLYLGYARDTLSPGAGMLLFGAAVAVLGTLGAVIRLRRERGTAGFAGGRVSRRRQIEGDLASLRDRVLRIQLRAKRPEDRDRLAALQREINSAIARVRFPSAEGDTKTSGLGRGSPDLLPAIRELEARILAEDLPGKEVMVRAAERVRTGRRRRLFRMTRNPVLWKEVNLLSASTSRVLFFVVLAVLVASELIFLAVVDADDLSDEPVAHIALLCVQSVLLLVLVSANAATSIVGEREQRTLDLLRVTLIRPAQVVAGKVIGSLRSIAVLSLVPFLHLAFFVPLSTLSLAGALCFFVVFAVLAAFFSVHGVRFSVAARRPALAILLSMGLLALLIFIVPIGVGILAFVSLGQMESAYNFLFFSNPVVLVVHPLVYLANDGGRGGADDTLMGYAAFWVLAYAAATVIRYVLLASAYRRSLDRDT